MLEMSGKLFRDAGKTAPKVHTGDAYAYRKLLDPKDH
jgi:hypothetical protein